MVLAALFNPGRAMDLSQITTFDDSPI